MNLAKRHVKLVYFLFFAILFFKTKIIPQSALSILQNTITVTAS